MKTLNKQTLATAISVALFTVFVSNNSGTAYRFEGLRILSARERETDDPQEFLLDEDQAFRLQDYLNQSDPAIAVVIQPFQGGADGSDRESDVPSADELAAKAAADKQAETDRIAAEQKDAADKAEAERIAAEQKAADELAEANRLAAEKKAADDKAAADKAAAAAAKKAAAKE